MFTLPTLPYNYNALEPVIDEETMHLHHDKHHQAYLDKLNAAVDSEPTLANKTAEELLADISQLPQKVSETIRNNGGGHVNHSLFWQLLAPVGSEATVLPETLKQLLEKNFGSVDEFKNQFKAAGMGRFGSGWVWLVKNGETVEIMATPNQDSPLSSGLTPLLGVDVWEHAYYLKYQNRRADYLDSIWQIINWQQVAKRANL